MSPVRYTLGNKNVILFGTGGETMNGSLWASTVDSIVTLVKSQHKPLDSGQDKEYVGCLSEFKPDSSGDKF